MNHKNVIIVGTGISGSLIAKILTDHVFSTLQNKFIHRAELKDDETYDDISILMLEAGLEAGIALDSNSAYKTYQSYMDQFVSAEAKVPNSPYPVIKAVPSPNVLDIQSIQQPIPSTKGYLVQTGPMPFASDAIRIAGGTTLHWLGTTPRMLPHDFKLTSQYGLKMPSPKTDDQIEIDWPFDYATLKPYYEMAEFEIGVSGSVAEQKYPIQQNLAEYYGNYDFPMQKIPQSYMDEKITQGLKHRTIHFNGQDIGLDFSPSPQARNSIPHPQFNAKKSIAATSGNEQSEVLYRFELKSLEFSRYKALGAVWNPYMGERCEGNASCVPICPVQAKYNALKTLKKALYKLDDKGQLSSHSSLSIQAQSVVYKLSVDAEQNISQIHLRKYADQHKTDFEEQVLDTSNSIVILAANALENAKILLNSKYQRDGVEYGVANSSDQVGRNLMDHMVMLTWGLFPEAVYPYRGPGSTTNISSFRDGSFRTQHAAWITPLDNWGWSWPAPSPGSDLDEFLQVGLIGKELRNALKNRLSKQVLFHFEIEQLPHPENRITLNDQYLDALGIPRPILHYHLTDYEKKGLQQAKKVSDQMFKTLNIDDFTQYNDTDTNTFEYEGERYSYNGAGHIVGTHKMGKSAEDSVTNSYCKSWDHANLYVVGAGNMTTLGTSNPTLTLAAFTIRAVESILTDLGRGIGG